jgi:hypothetical protein
MKKLIELGAMVLVCASLLFGGDPWHNSIICAGTAEFKDAVTCSTTVQIIGVTTCGAITSSGNLTVGGNTVTAGVINLGVGMTGELHPLSVGGTLAAAANRFNVDTLGRMTINATSVTAARIDSINITSDSLHFYSGGQTFGIPKHTGT